MSNATTLTRNVTLVIEDCISCGIVHAIPQQLRDHYRQNGGYWYCPNGHSQGWDVKNSLSVAEKKDREIAQLQSRLAYKDDQIKAEQKRASAAKGELTKFKNRVDNGVCPCCNRSFQNLRRHIANKHPELTETVS